MHFRYAQTIDNRIVTFDLGGVLLDWNPRNLYRKLLPTDEEVETFLRDVCNQEWNEQQDAGRSAADAIEELASRFPNKRELIEAYYGRFDEMIAGVIDDNLSLARELKENGTRLFALTNWSADTFHAVSNYPILELFEGVLVSGTVGLKKPDPRIYKLFLERFSLSPSQVLFIDDVAANVAAAQACGITALHYTWGEPVREQVLSWLR